MTHWHIETTTTTKPRDNAEERLQQALWQHIQWRLNPACIAYHPANGGLRSKAAAARMKTMGVVPGVADLAFVMPDGRAAYIELKSPGRHGVQSVQQKAFEAKCIALGVPYLLTASLDEAMAHLVSWGVISPEASLTKRP